MSASIPIALTLPTLARGASARELAQRLRQAIQSGALAPSVRLPPTRDLAQQLDLGRNTVTAAYAFLQAEGWIEGQGRRGTFVCAWTGSRRDGSLRALSTGAAAGSQATKLTRRLAAAKPDHVPPHADWRLGQASTLTLPVAVWRKACREVGRHLPPADYGDPRGDPDLRRGIAQWLAQRRALLVSHDQIIVTQGAAQGIAQLAELLLRPGDSCVVENPGYARAAQLFEQQGANVFWAPVDEDGLDVEAAFAAPKAPALLHLTPSHHYPLGVRLGGPRRLLLLEKARRHGTLVLENEYDHEFVGSGPHHAPLMAAAPDRTVLVSTFAKAISPALRLGYVVAPPDIAERLAQTVDAGHRQTSWPVQRAVGWLLASGELDRHLRRVHRHCERLRERLHERTHRWAQQLRVSTESSGQHVLLSLCDAKSSRALQRQLVQAGVRVEAMDRFTSGATRWHGVLFSYGQMQLATLDRAMDVLDQAMRRVA